MIRLSMCGMEMIFQSTLPRGERPAPTKKLSLVTKISIHAPARGATRSAADKMASELEFQSTLPRGERLGNAGRCSGIQNFNPRSREGSDGAVGDGVSDDTISIHAPARGATCDLQIKIKKSKFQSTLPRGERQEVHSLRCRQKHISIHAPARGATKWDRTYVPGYYDFNPRSREGSDDQTAFSSLIYTVISIHAPARGATIIMLSTVGSLKFQSTLPRGERLVFKVHLLFYIYHFNPRSREGSDKRFANATSQDYDFNPRSREGSDQKLNLKREGILDFNPRSREGSDSKFHQKSFHYS